jgi:hypothetical protein
MGSVLITLVKTSYNTIFNVYETGHKSSRYEERWFFYRDVIHRKWCDYPSLREGVYLYIMNPWKNTTKIHGGGGWCTYPTVKSSKE